MGQRFADVEFPLLFSDYSVGFVGVFIALYAAAYLYIQEDQVQAAVLQADQGHLGCVWATSRSVEEHR